MTSEAHPVIADLRDSLAPSRSASEFLGKLEGRIHQLVASMVNGRVLPKPEADALRAAIFDLVRSEALPKLAARNPKDGIRLLDLLKAYRHTSLEPERAALEAARAAASPPPPAATWPEIAALRAAAERHPDVAKLSAPLRSADFVQELARDGLSLPDELLALYAAVDGFDLSCVSAPYLPVFSLLPSVSIDVSDADGQYPKRPVVFQGGDDVQLSVYARPAGGFGLVYEYGPDPVGEIPLDLRALLRFGLDRMNADKEALLDQWSWERFFGTSDDERA